jgi:hypothetical protein
MPVHRQAFAFLPAFRRAYFPMEINSDFLPGVQAASIGGKGWWRNRLHLSFVHA